MTPATILLGFAFIVAAIAVARYANEVASLRYQLHMEQLRSAELVAQLNKARKERTPQ